MQKKQKNIGQPQVKGPDWFIIGFFIIAHTLAAIGLTMPTRGGMIAFAILYPITALGITLGYHRYFTHRSFKSPRWLSYIFAVMGTMALQGSLIEWIAHHRMHHAGSDTNRDPHNARRGFWYSHLMWMFVVMPEFDDQRNMRRYTRDIIADPFLFWLCKPWVMIGMQVLIGIICWRLGGIEAMMWGVWVRIVALYHATWAVNSAAHIWGYRNYDVGDLATNNWFVALITMGEGWHNNHHAFSESARHGQKWWELDVTWLLIRTLKALGLATEIKLAPGLSPPSLAVSPSVAVPDIAAAGK